MSLKNSAKKLETYDPTKSISALNAEASAKAIDISVPDYPVILKVVTNETNQPTKVDQQKQQPNSIDIKSQSSTEGQTSPSTTPSKQSTEASGENVVEPEDDNSSQSESVEQSDLEPTQSEEIEN